MNGSGLGGQEQACEHACARSREGDDSFKRLYNPKGIEGHRTKFKQVTNIYSDLDVSRFDERRLITFTESSKVKGKGHVSQVSLDVSLDALDHWAL